MSELKACRFGNKCESKRLGVYPTAPLMPDTTEYFYKQSGTDHNRSECIECYKAMVRNPKWSANQVGAMAVTAFINALSKQGIPARKCARGTVEAFGIAQIKTIGSQPYKSKDGWLVNFTSLKNRGVIKEDLIAFCLFDDDREHIKHLCIFPPNYEPFFVVRTGLLKHGVLILNNPNHRKEGYCVLTLDDVRRHENNWRLVRSTVDDLTVHLKTGNLEQYRHDRAHYIPVNKPKPGHRVRPFAA